MGFRLFYLDASGTKYDFYGAEATRNLARNESNFFTIDLSNQYATLPAGAKLGLRIRETTSYEVRIYLGYDAYNSGQKSGILQVTYGSGTTTTTLATTTTTTTMGTTTTTLAPIGPPVNSENTDTASGNDGYYQVNYNWDGRGYNWLEDGQVYHFRIEYLRPEIPNAGNKYEYQVKVWIFTGGETSSWSAAKLAAFKDVRKTIYDDPLGDSTLHIGNPRIVKTIKAGNSLQLDPGYHVDLERILFGFTQGTGGRTQYITVKDFELFFLKRYPAHFPGEYPDNW